MTRRVWPGPAQHLVHRLFEVPAKLTVAGGLRRHRSVSVRQPVLTGLPAWPDRATALAEVGRLGAMARWTASGDRRGRMICELMCRHAALAAMLAPLAVRSVPAAVAIDGVRHSWTSYHRTLANLVLAESAAALLLQVTCPTTALVGADDRVTAPGWASRLAVEQPSLRLSVLAGVDHHPALRAPRRVAAAVADEAVA